MAVTTVARRLATPWTYRDAKIEVYGRDEAVPMPATVQAYQKHVLERIAAPEEIYAEFVRSGISDPQEFWTGYWMNHWALAVLNPTPLRQSIFIGAVFTTGDRHQTWCQALTYDTDAVKRARHTQYLWRAFQSQAAANVWYWPGETVWSSMVDLDSVVKVLADGYGGGTVTRTRDLGPDEYVLILKEHYPDLNDARARAEELCAS